MLTREITFHPAYDKRSADPKKNYGVHGVDLCFWLTAARHGLLWEVQTNWNLPHIQAIRDAELPEPGLPYYSHKPSPAALSFHQPYTPQGERARDNCEVTGGACYSDATFCTDDLFQLLVAEGSEGVWKELEARFWARWPELVVAIKT